MEYLPHIRRHFSFFLFFALLPGALGAQADSLVARTRLDLSGLLHLQYSFSLSDSFDYRGMFRPEPVRADFLLRRARVRGRVELDRRWSVFAMANLAELTTRPAGPVLEMATIGYRRGEALRLTAGLHRPLWGVEDQYPVEAHRSIDWSRQYGVFGRGGWQSFQWGLTASGRLKHFLPIPLDYAVGVHEGRGRNWRDADAGLFSYARLSVDLPAGVRLGLNGALGRRRGQGGDACAVDLRWESHPGDRWSVYLELEYKEGTNFDQLCRRYDANGAASAADFRMRGLLLLPEVGYAPAAGLLSRIDLSVRGEWLDECLAAPGRGVFIATPQLSVAFAGASPPRLQLAWIGEWYDAGPAAGGGQDHSRLVAQLQVRL